VLSIVAVGLTLALLTGLQRREVLLMFVTVLIAAANWLWARPRHLEANSKAKSGGSPVSAGYGMTINNGEIHMIARQWIGQTLESDADRYFKYLEETGVREIRAAKGNLGVWLLRRVYDGRAEFIFISLWDSLESVKAFAGPEYEKAVYYPEDEKFLLSLNPHVTHYEVLLGTV
jgi:heme-degrading monooxygenase HmoA